MPVVSGDYLRVSCNFELGNGTQYQNIYHYLRDGPGAFGDAAHVAAIKAGLDLAYLALIDMVKDDVVPKLSFVDRIAWAIDKWAVVENIGTFVPVFVPTVITDALPHQCSPYVVFKTTRPKSVGKKYLFPFAETQQADSLLTVAGVNAVVAYAAEVIKDLALDATNKLFPGIVRTAAEHWLTFQVAVVNDVIGTQRRRKPGVGA